MDDIWTYEDLGIPDSMVLREYQERYTEKGLSDDAGFVALSLRRLFPGEFPVRTLVNWCWHSRVRFLKALRELEDAGWLKVTAKRWRQMRNLRLR